MWNSLRLLLVVILFVTVISAEFSKVQEPLSKDIDQPKNVKNFPKAFGKILEGLIPSSLKSFSGLILGNLDTGLIFQSAVGYVIPTARYNTRISQQCRDDSWLYAESLMNFTEWALKMFDASGKIPDGILSGNYHSMGHFDQCLKIRAGEEHDSSAKFSGKYCPVFILPKIVPKKGKLDRTFESFLDSSSLLKSASKIDTESMKNFDARTLPSLYPNFAFCLPSSCSASDIEVAMRDIIGSIGDQPIDGMEIFPYTTEQFCTAGGIHRSFDAATTTAILVVSVLVLFLIIGTTYDAILRRNVDYCTEKLHICQRSLLSFSLLTNSAHVLDTRNTSEGNLDCLHGIRFLSMTWVVLGHTWVMAAQDSNANTPMAKEDGRYWAYQAISNYSVPVDTFFFLSGLLVAYIKLHELEKRKGKLNLFSMYLHRFLRLTPVYAFILFFNATFLSHMGSGPFWGKVVQMSENCGSAWWRHLLYMNNFFAASEQSCMGETWYMAVDMQMFLISPFFIYTLWRWNKTGITIVIGAIVAFTSITMIIVVTNNMPPTFIHFATTNPSRSLAFFEKYYEVPWCRIMPYLVGILMGYVFHRLRNQVIVMNACVLFAGWLAATATALAVVYGLAGHFVEGEPPVVSAAASVLYASLHRTAWAVSLSWLVFACVHGYGGLVNRFLSWSIFLPLSRLTYCSYLIHMNFIKFRYGNMRSIPYYTTVDMFTQFVANLAVSMGLAFVATLCIETPFLRLEKTLFDNKSRQLNFPSRFNVLHLDYAEKKTTEVGKGSIGNRDHSHKNI